MTERDLVIAAENLVGIGVKLATEGDLLGPWVKPDSIIRLERFLFDEEGKEFDFFEVEPIFFQAIHLKRRWRFSGLLNFMERVMG